MRFTEREMTAAVDAVARRMFGATRPPWKRGGTDAAWDALPPIERFNRRSAVGEVVLPALTALPDRPTVGARPEFTPEELAGVAESTGRARLEHRRPGAWDAMPERRRKRLVQANVALTRLALEAMPLRQDPDDLTAPDHP